VNWVRLLLGHVLYVVNWVKVGYCLVESGVNWVKVFAQLSLV